LMDHLGYVEQRKQSQPTKSILAHQELNTILDFAEDQAKYKRWNEAYKAEVQRAVQTVRQHIKEGKL